MAREQRIVRPGMVITIPEPRESVENAEAVRFARKVADNLRDLPTLRSAILKSCIDLDALETDPEVVSLYDAMQVVADSGVEDEMVCFVEASRTLTRDLQRSLERETYL